MWEHRDVGLYSSRNIEMWDYTDRCMTILIQLGVHRVVGPYSVGKMHMWDYTQL